MMKKLLENANITYSKLSVDISLTEGINDPEYLRFIHKINGGYFYNRSLIMYGLGSVPYQASYVEINLLLASTYGNFLKGCKSFGCDLFGNQFIFLDTSIGFLNIETGDIEEIADDFRSWLSLLNNETDYYTGESILLDWESANGHRIELNERLYPVKPFVVGGEYETSSLRSMDIKKLINYSWSIASQICDLPDGTPIRLKIEE